jgi:hypothetical protein
VEDVQKPVYGGASEVNKAKKEVARIVGVDRISQEKEDLQIHSDTFWSSYRAKVCI